MALWISIAIVTLVATALVVWPILSTRRPQSDPRHDDERRLAVFRDRKQEIDRERDAGRLTAAEAEQAQADLVRQLADDFPAAQAATLSPGASYASGSRRGAWLVALAVAVLVPLVAFGVYRQVGAPHLAAVDGTGRDTQVGPEQIEAMIAQIEQRTREQPQDGEAWAMLAEARKMQGRHDEAVPAFEKALERIPDDPRLLTDFAESVALLAGGDFAGRPLQLLERALQIDPDEPKAVALMGAAQYRLGNLPRARSYLQQLAGFLAPGSDEARQIAGILERIDGEIAQAGQGMAPPVAGSGATGTRDGAPGAARAPDGSAPAPIAGTARIDPSLAAQAADGGTLFVIARDPAGPPAPIAVLRVPDASFPATFSLDDSNAMDPARRLSSAGSLEIEARLSRSGQAMRAPGDLYGRVSGVRPGQRELEIVIDRVVPR